MTRRIVVALLALLVSGQVFAWHWENSVMEDLGADKGDLRFVQLMVADKGDTLASAAQIFLRSPEGVRFVQKGGNAQAVVQATILALNSRLASKLGHQNRFPKVTWGGTGGKQATYQSPEAIAIKPGLSYMLFVGPQGLKESVTKPISAKEKPATKAAKPAHQTQAKPKAKPQPPKPRPQPTAIVLGVGL